MQIQLTELVVWLTCFATQSKADVEFIRKVLDEAGGHQTKIISKIENLAGTN
jgi:pyruvate kinase